MQKVREFDDWLTEKLKNPKFKRFYEEEAKRMSIAVKIAQAREAAGLSQKELAARMGTTLQAISRLESGNCSYTLRTLAKIAEVTGTRLKIDLVPLS
jgi:ribosome-binding protein aMBF1 (putative translation factor)